MSYDQQLADAERELSDLRAENERLRRMFENLAASTADLERADRAEAEVERLRREMDDRWTAQQSCCQSWITSHRVAVERAERAEAAAELARRDMRDAESEAEESLRRAERAEAEVERLKRINCGLQVRVLEAGCRSPEITDEVVDRALREFYRYRPPCSIRDWMRCALEAVWPAQDATDCRVSSPDVVDRVADALWEQNCERNCLSSQPRPDSWGLDDALTIVRRVASAGIDDRDDDR